MCAYVCIDNEKFGKKLLRVEKIPFFISWFLILLFFILALKTMFYDNQKIEKKKN